MTDGWGAADSRGSWLRVAGSASDFDVDGQAAQITFTAAGAAREVVLNSVSQLSGQLLYRWSVEKAAVGGYHELLVVSRSQDVTGATWYGVNVQE